MPLVPKAGHGEGTLGSGLVGLAERKASLSSFWGQGGFSAGFWGTGCSSQRPRCQPENSPRPLDFPWRPAKGFGLLAVFGARNVLPPSSRQPPWELFPCLCCAEKSCWTLGKQMPLGCVSLVTQSETPAGQGMGNLCHAFLSSTHLLLPLPR